MSEGKLSRKWADNLKDAKKYKEGIVCILFCLFSLVTIGCISGSNSTSNPSGPADSFTLCEGIRPEVCTQEYVPVCGEYSDGSRKTYSNACSACSDINVVRYQPDSCP